MVDALLEEAHASGHEARRADAVLERGHHLAVLREREVRVVVIDLHLFLEVRLVGPRARVQVVDDHARGVGGERPHHQRMDVVGARDDLQVRRHVGGEGEAVGPVGHRRHAPEARLAVGSHGRGVVDGARAPVLAQVHGVLVGAAAMRPERLRVHDLHVVDVDEVLDHELPVAGQVEDELGAERAVLHPQEADVGREVGQEGRKGLGGGIEVDPHPPPHVPPAGAGAGTTRRRTRRLLHEGRAEELTRQVVRPGVVRTLELRSRCRRPWRPPRRGGRRRWRARERRRRGRARSRGARP